MHRPVILCPLAIERRAASRLLKGSADVVLTGPGGEAVADAVAEVCETRPPLVVLFGLAGGLRRCEPAPRIGKVMDRDAREWNPPVVAPGDEAPVTVVGVDEPVLHPARKKQMGAAYGAALVDCESHAFAQACDSAGLKWAVVRGVCDGPDEALPAHVTQWVDDKGRTRVWRVAGAVLLSPGVLRAVFMMGIRSRPALKAAGVRLKSLLASQAMPFGGGRHEKKSDAPSRQNPIERQLGRRSARLNDPPGHGKRAGR